MAERVDSSGAVESIRERAVQQHRRARARQPTLILAVVGGTAVILLALIALLPLGREPERGESSGLRASIQRSPRNSGRGPVASPGTIAFVGFDQSYNPALYVAGSDEAGLRLVLEKGESSGVSWSADGTHIVIDRALGEGLAELLVVDVRTGDQATITTNRNPQEPSWSPVDAEIAFGTGSGDLFIVNVDGTNLRQVTVSGDACNDFHPTWSPVGRRIAFTRDCTVGGDPGIYILDVWEASETLVLSASKAGTPPHGLAWSPDGSTIAFADWPYDETKGIFLVEPSGIGLRKLTSGFDVQPAWSPDGSAIAFIRDGRILTVAAGGGEPQELLAPPDIQVGYFDWTE